jgi:citrate lyase beta subunit
MVIPELRDEFCNGSFDTVFDGSFATGSSDSRADPGRCDDRGVMTSSTSALTDDRRVSIAADARSRSDAILGRLAAETTSLDPRHLVQRTHLTCPATVWKYVEAAVTRSDADLVMLDLEDSIPRGDEQALARGRAHVARAFLELDWGRRLRYFRPRGTELDPGHEDLIHVLSLAGGRVEGIILPKVERADEVRSVDRTLGALERALDLPEGAVRVQVLIESVRAEEAAFKIAGASPRIAGLIFGAFDYWSSLRVPHLTYRPDHPLVCQARARIVKAAASVGVPAIAEMTLEFPTRDKTEAERAIALDRCRQDALLAREQGMHGKWVGIPAQVPAANPVFSLEPSVIERAIREARAFAQAEREGRGAVMIDGRMADRATDRVHRVALAFARAQGMLDDALSAELGVR